MKTTYEITTPGRHDERITMNISAATLSAARKEAQKLAAETGKPMLIERVTGRGNSTIVERVVA